MTRDLRRSGFTLAEVAVTIVIVGIALVLVLQGLNTSKVTAAHTRNQKLARDLGLYTLGQIESGLLRDDLESGMVGNYAEEGYPDFNWEIAVGDDALRQTNQSQDGKFDSWAPTAAEEEAKKDKNKDEDAEEPFEKIRIRVTYPKIREFENELTLERWIPWKQAYGEAEGDNASKNAKASKGTSKGAAQVGGSATGGSASGSGTKGSTKP
ncbi:MAG: type II secretion system protein [Planctomycetota bacterium]|nr:type II secretion system protein [Planctomycetota bacterium]